MQLKAMPTNFKASGKREIEGHAAVFGNRDSYGDVIQPGAFARTLANDRGRVKVLWQHDASNPIGKPLSMSEDDRGLFVTARIADTALGRDAMALFDAEVIDELSIGYDSIVEEYDNEKNVRNLREIKLWEFSPVTWAANDLAKITSVKSASDLDAVLDRLERLEWSRGRLESPRLTERVTKAIGTLTGIRDGITPIESVASPSGTPSPAELASNTVDAVTALSDFKHKLLAAATLRDLQAFGENLRRQ